MMDEWIIEYIKSNYYVSATDYLFHEAFFAEFGGRRKETCFGAQTVYKAQKRLKKLWERDILERHRNTIRARDGLSKWVYVYKLHEPEWVVQWTEIE